MYDVTNHDLSVTAGQCAVFGQERLVLDMDGLRDTAEGCLVDGAVWLLDEALEGVHPHPPLRGNYHLSFIIKRGGPSTEQFCAIKSS